MKERWFLEGELGYQHCITEIQGNGCWAGKHDRFLLEILKVDLRMDMKVKQTRLLLIRFLPRDRPQQGELDLGGGMPPEWAVETG